MPTAVTMPVVGQPARTPFQVLRVEAVVAAAYAVAVAVWVVGGAHLPGGRWLAVHLFTLGVVTNVVAAFAQHFAATLTRQPETPRTWPLLGLNAGVVATLVGISAGLPLLTGAGATAVTAGVMHSYVVIRRRRKAALGARFVFIVRTYERAHGAFVHGALLGLGMGVGVISGSWYGTARLAHLHVNVLGWAGLTLLATLVFFGPTVLRVRIREGADAAAGVWLRRSATALTVGVVALLCSAVGGAAGTGLRLAAAAMLGVYAVGVVVVCLPVLLAARSSRWPSVSGGLIQGACAWFAVAAWLDVAVVATGQWRYLDVVGVALLAGTLAQAITAAVGYVGPMLSGLGAQARQQVRQRIEWAPGVRPVLFNVGVALVVAATALGTGAGVAGAWTVRTGWTVVALTVVVQLGAAALAASRRRVVA